MFYFLIRKLLKQILPLATLYFTGRSLWEMLTTPEELLKRRTYNVTAMSFTPKELVEEVKKHVPTLTVSYEPDSRQNIGMHFYLSLRKI